MVPSTPSRLPAGLVQLQAALLRGTLLAQGVGVGTVSKSTCPSVLTDPANPAPAPSIFRRKIDARPTRASS
jgi:hypothetical protein